MRRIVLVLATMAPAILLAGGVALAAHIKGDGSDNVLTGTESRDTINPFGGNDMVYALGGNDYVRHSFGDDTIYGGAGRDTLRGGRGTDTIYGGPEKDLIDCAYLETRADDVADTAFADREDTVVDCKDVKDDPTTPQS
jgi:Ca2+-binding RTX toxin-like protein